jgi:hypothetical protein
VGAIGVTLAGGCARIPNLFREDGPAAREPLDSPTAAHVYASQEPVAIREREWSTAHLAPASGAVSHGPLYFEDPFEDKGAGRSDYRWGWEDYVAMPYGFFRYLLNGAALPVSLIVTPPWSEMESDGRVSRQLLGYDHDAEPAARRRAREARSDTDANPADDLPTQDRPHQPVRDPVPDADPSQDAAFLSPGAPRLSGMP